MAAHARNIARLEIAKRQGKLASMYFDLATTFALGLVVAKQTEFPMAASGLQLSRDQLVSKATFDALRDSPPELFPFFALADATALAAAFAAQHPYDDAAVADAMSELDNDFLKGVINDLNRWLPPASLHIWTAEQQREQQRRVDAELKKALVPKAMAAANRDVEMALAGVAASTQSTIVDLARKEATKAAREVLQRQKRSARKKSSGGGEIQTPLPTNDGPSTSNGSGRPGGRSKARSSPTSTPARGKGKKKGRGKGRGKGKNSSPSTRNRQPSPSSPAKGGNRGGARRGGRPKGAGRR